MVTIANPIAAMQAGAQYATQLRDAQRQNALAQLFQTQGAGIMSGDQNALSAYAAIDPQGAMQAQNNALSMQSTQQDMAFSAEKMQMLRDDAKAKAAEHAAQMTAEQRAAEAAKTSQIMSGAAAMYSKGDKAGYSAFLQSQGIDPAQYSFEQFPAYAAMADGALEALKTFDAMKPQAPEWSPATPEQAQQYGAAAGQINAQTGEFKPINPPSGMSIQTNPDGTMSLVQGPGAGMGKPLTEAEGKNARFLIRMKDAGATLDRLESQGTNLAASLMAKDPTGLANYAQTPEFQMYDQAKRDFVNAILRRESGAAISPSEFANAEQQYFPVPGDSTEVIAQKRKNRENAVKGVEVGSGAGASNPLVTGDNSMNGTQASPIEVGPAGEGFDKVKPGQYFKTADGFIYQK